MFIILILFVIMNGIFAYQNYNEGNYKGALLNAFACGFCLFASVVEFAR